MMHFLLPVGISFYTFETFSYTIDVYNNKLKAERSFWIYALFISFFPKLVAGPIERSENLIPQFHRKTIISISNLILGSKYIIIGFFMKLVVADRLSIYVDSVYNNVNAHSGLTFIIATVSFSFQILCDFAGYSTIALGIAKLLDYQLMLNFRRPYLAMSFSEFWKRWHISLSSWFRDYVYIPLGGNRGSKFKLYRNLFITFLISGLWHGANWTFVVWGALHGVYLIVENTIIKKQKKILFTNYFATRMIKRVFIFMLVSFAWIFFRANSLSDALKIVYKSFDFSQPVFVDASTLFFGAIAVSILLLIDHFAERTNINTFNSDKLSFYSVLLFSFLLILILYFGVFDGGQFIYFQF
jgi:D-alanyl-lipoteichoic acid acyltransferase DltB (MBOAT superfamily)